jgi:hypothetical protein
MTDTPSLIHRAYAAFANGLIERMDIEERAEEENASAALSRIEQAN